MKLVCVDRDGTINKDENFYLGSQENWRELVEFLPGIIEGVSRLNSEGIRPFIITQQSGVALGKLDEARMTEVNEFVIQRAREVGADFAGYFCCPFIERKKADDYITKGRVVIPDYIRDNHPDIKPNSGMVRQAARALGFNRLGDLDVYVAGDRFSDVMTGIYSGGTGILIAGYKTQELDDVRKVEALGDSLRRRTFVAEDFLGAVKFILDIVN